MAETKTNMSVVLKSNAMKELADNLHLSEEQKMKATSRALQLSGDEKLRNCDPFSIARFCFETSRYNFTRDDSAYPVPYKNSIQTQIGYQGWKELAFRTGKYQNIECSKVYKCDKVTRDRATGTLHVEFCDDWTQASGEPVGYYAYATDHTGKVVASVLLSKEEAMKHGKRYSKSYGNLWTSDFEKMAMKTAIKMLVTKHLDLTDVSTNVTALIEEAKIQDQIVHGRDRDVYADNPSSHETIDVTSQTETTPKSNVTNRIAPSSPETKENDKTPTKEETKPSEAENDDSQVAEFEGLFDESEDK